MVGDRLQRDLPLYNPWWKSNEPPSDPPYREALRSDYKHHETGARENNIYTLIGPQGTGKTTTLYQLIHRLITEHDTPPDNILYLPLDNPLYSLNGSEFLIRVVEWYESYILRQDRSEAGPHYLIFDDIYHVPEWESQLETILANAPNTHIIVTTATEDEQVRSVKDSIESADSSIILPPKFYDYLDHNSSVPIDEKSHIYQTRKRLIGKDGTSVSELPESLTDLYHHFENHQSAVKSSMRDYFISRSFENASLEQDDLIDIKQRIQLALFKEIPHFESVAQPSDLYVLCTLAAREPFSEYDFKWLSEELETDRRTIRKYLRLLEEFLILTPSFKYGYERHRELRMYLRDPRYVNALADRAGDTALTDSEHEARLLRMVAFDHLKRLTFYLNDYQDNPVSYWSEDGHTVDFVIEANDTPVPITLSHQRGQEQAINNTAAFLETEAGTVGLVSGPDIERPYLTEDSVMQMPLWELLVMC